MEDTPSDKSSRLFRFVETLLASRLKDGGDTWVKLAWTWMLLRVLVYSTFDATHCCRC